MSATGAPVTERTENVVKKNRALHADFRVQVLRRAEDLRWRKCRPSSRIRPSVERLRWRKSDQGALGEVFAELK